MTRKLIKFNLFCFKLFPRVVQKHQLGEVRNKITPSSCIFSGIFLPKIVKITVFDQAMADERRGCFISTHGVDPEIAHTIISSLPICIV